MLIACVSGALSGEFRRVDSQRNGLSEVKTNYKQGSASGGRPPKQPASDEAGDAGVELAAPAAHAPAPSDGACSPAVVRHPSCVRLSCHSSVVLATRVHAVAAQRAVATQRVASRRDSEPPPQSRDYLLANNSRQRYRDRDRTRWAHTAHSRPTGMDVFLSECSPSE